MTNEYKIENKEMQRIADAISRGGLSNYKYLFMDNKHIITAKSDTHKCSEGLFYMEISEDGLLYSTLQEDDNSYLLANSYVKNHIFTFDRNMGKALKPKELNERLELLISTFGKGLQWNIKNAYFTERYDEIWYELQDEENCGGFSVSLDGRLIEGREAGHTLCNGLFRQEFDINNKNEHLPFGIKSTEYKVEEYIFHGGSLTIQRGFYSKTEAKVFAQMLEGQGKDMFTTFSVEECK